MRGELEFGMEAERVKWLPFDGNYLSARNK